MSPAARGFRPRPTGGHLTEPNQKSQAFFVTFSGFLPVFSRCVVKIRKIRNEEQKNQGRTPREKLGWLRAPRPIETKSDGGGRRSSGCGCDNTGRTETPLPLRRYRNPPQVAALLCGLPGGSRGQSAGSAKPPYTQGARRLSGSGYLGDGEQSNDGKSDDDGTHDGSPNTPIASSSGSHWYRFPFSSSTMTTSRRGTSAWHGYMAALCHTLLPQWSHICSHVCGSYHH